MSSCSWLNVALSFPMRLFGTGARNSAGALPARLRRRRPRPGDKWRRDEVFIRIQGVLHYLWRGVDQHGVVLDILVQEHRDAKAAKRFFRRLLKGLDYVPRVIVTDKLRRYGVAKRRLLADVEQRQSRDLNNRAENSHRPTPRRERQMQRFKSPEQAQDFLSAHAFIHGHFHPRRHLLAADAYRALRSVAFDVWHHETGDMTRTGETFWAPARPSEVSAGESHLRFIWHFYAFKAPLASVLLHIWRTRVFKSLVAALLRWQSPPRRRLRCKSLSHKWTRTPTGPRPITSPSRWIRARP